MSLISNLMVLIGMVSAVVLALDLLRRKARAWAAIRVDSRGRTAVLAAPLLVTWFGVWLSGAVNTIWTFTVGIGVLLALLLGTVLLRTAHVARRDQQVAPPALAVLLVVLALFQLGCLLTVRLALVPCGQAKAAPGLDSDVIDGAAKSLGLPIVGLLVLLAAGLIVAQRARRATVSAAARCGAPTPPPARPAAGGLRQRWRAGYRRLVRRNPLWAWLWVGTLVVLPFLVPLAQSGAGHLTIFGLATPEFGKALFLVVLAVVVNRYSVEAVAFNRIGIRGAWLELRQDFGSHRRRNLREFERRTRFLLYPTALVGAVGACSAIRQDFGSLIPVLAATLGVVWAALTIEARATPFGTDGASGSRWARLARWGHPAGLRYLRPYALVAGALLCFAAVVASFTDYVHERVKIWRDPWAFRWNPGCYTPPDGTPVPARLPDGATVCVRVGAADLESERSQLAHAISAVNDGGLWGRGLGYVLSPPLSDASTDFVIPAAWNKLGGLTVLTCAVAIAVLGLALIRLPASLSPPSSWESSETGGAQASRQRLTIAALLATGLSALISGQFLFVFAATVGAIPHSGITAPFLSRGPQADLALFLALAIVGAASYWSTQQAAVSANGVERRIGHRPVTMPGVLRRLPTPPAQVLVGLSFVLCLFIAVELTTTPYRAPFPGKGVWSAYSEQRPSCGEVQVTWKGDVATPTPFDPSRCSTDLVAAHQTDVDLTVGTTVLRQNSAGDWLDTRCARGRLTASDLGGLVKIGDSGVGVLDDPGAIATLTTTGTTLRQRLVPNATKSAGGLALGLDAALQKRLNAAITQDGPGRALPLAGGLVVMDTGTGRILAMTSAPQRPVVAGDHGCRATTGSTTESTPSKADTTAFSGRKDVSQWERDHAKYGNLGSDGLVNLGTQECRLGERDEKIRARCFRYEMREDTTALASAATPASEQTADRRYVGADPSIEADQIPSSTVNRAVGTWFGLGSTFKVVVAAAYLNQSSTHRATDRIDAPPVAIDENGKEIHNFTDGSCKGTVDGKISLTDALAYSCNTAFATLGKNLTWPVVRAMAARLGLDVSDDAQNPTPQRFAGFQAAGSQFGVDTRVPMTPFAGVGLDSIGEGDDKGTPVGMAAVMAAIGNDGLPVAPMLVTSTTTPGTGRTTAVAPVQRPRALSSAAAEQLRVALSQTSVYGTARGLKAGDGDSLWVKTGTHEVRTGDDCPPGVFTCRTSWVVGIVETTQGRRVSFAIAVDAHNDSDGGKRTKWLAQQIVNQFH